MAMQRIRGIFIDIDDTVVPTNGRVHSLLFVGLRQLSLLIRRANTQLLAPIGFVTGREASYVLGFSRSMEQPNSWSVVESGLLLFNPKTQQRLYHPALTSEVRRLFQRICQERIPLLQQKYPIAPYVGKEVNIALERENGAILAIETLGALVREALSDLLASGLIELNVSSIAVDISPRGIDKGAGIVFWSQVTAVDLKEVLVIGDSLGDKPAADKVGFVGCPANAKEDFKKIVRARGGYGYISPFELAEGVADVICHFTGVKVT